MPGHYLNHSGFSDFLVDVCWVQSINGSTLQLLLKAILNSRTQFHSLADPLFQLYMTMCILSPNTHMHTQTMGGTVLIAFCTALKGWPPGFCSPSIGFIMVAVRPYSCCIISETYFPVFLAPLWAFPCSFHPKPFTLCPPVIPPKVAFLFYEHSTTCLVSLHLP